MRARVPNQQGVRPEGTRWIEGGKILEMKGSRPIPLVREGATALVGRAYLVGDRLFRFDDKGKGFPVDREVSHLFGETYMRKGLLYFMKPGSQPVKVTQQFTQVYNRALLNNKMLYWIRDDGMVVLVDDGIEPGGVVGRMYRKGMALYYIMKNGRRKLVSKRVTGASPRLYLKGDQLCCVDEDGESMIVTNGVTQVGGDDTVDAFMKGEQLFAMTEGNDFAHVTGNVILLHGRHFIIQRARNKKSVYEMTGGDSFQMISSMPEAVFELEKQAGVAELPKRPQRKPLGSV